jgi:hypothetical protein
MAERWPIKRIPGLKATIAESPACPQAVTASQVAKKSKGASRFSFLVQIPALAGVTEAEKPQKPA